MISSRKIIAFCLCTLASTLGHFNLVDAFGHSGGQNNGLAEILAAGLVTLMLRDGGNGLFGGGGRSAGHEAQGRHNYVQGAEYASLGHNIPMQDYGSEFEIFDYVPSFGGHRYNLGDIENSYPLNEFDLIPDVEDAGLGQDLGLDAKMYSHARAIINNDVDNIVEDLRRKALQRQIQNEENSEENTKESKEELD